MMKETLLTLTHFEVIADCKIEMHVVTSKFQPFEQKQQMRVAADKQCAANRVSKIALPFAADKLSRDNPGMRAGHL